MKNIKANLELLNLKETLNNDPLILTNCLLDAEKLTGNKVNTLDIDDIENIVLNHIDRIIIIEAAKDKVNYRLTQYKLWLDMWIDDELYRVTNWFTYDKVTNTFDDAEVFADNRDLKAV